MKLYKLRSLASLEFLLDIVLNERLYCAHFQDLNDPFEGVFLATTFRHTSAFSPFLGRTEHSLTNVAGLKNVGNFCRVCSLSASIKDVRQWAHYADGHKGVAIEIDFTDHDGDAVPVDYLTELKKYSTSTLLNNPYPEEILRQKTVHWQYENERRILQSDPYYSVRGRVTSVLLGARVSAAHRELLGKLLPKGIEMIETRISETTLEVEALIAPNISFKRAPEGAG